MDKENGCRHSCLGFLTNESLSSRYDISFTVNKQIEK